MTDLIDTYLENRFRVQPNHTNTHDTGHGGIVMKWLDEVGAMSAMRFASETVVTAQMGPINFETPVPLGDIVLIESFVYDSGRTSIDVQLNAYAEAARTGERQPLTTTQAVYVAIDEATADPIPVPDLTVNSETGRELLDRMANEE